MLGSGAVLVIQRVFAAGWAAGFGLYRDGETPKSGLKIVGDVGGELLVMNWCGAREFAPGDEFVCAVTSLALRQKASSARPRLLFIQNVRDTGVECVQVVRKLFRIEIR